MVLQLEDDLIWFSIADKDILMWARCVAAERGLAVDLSEPDVSPLAIQGPKAELVMASIFGDWVKDLKYFWFKQTELMGIPLVVARSGYSKQGGFELYLMDGSRGSELWNIVREAGKPWDIGPGSPNPVERIESGLLSFGGDTDDQTNPFEVRLERYVDLSLDDEVIGIPALRQIVEQGVRRHQLGIILDAPGPNAGHWVWYDILSEGRKVGDMTNGVWSSRKERTIGFALISRDFQPGAEVTVSKNGENVPAQLCELPFY